MSFIDFLRRYTLPVAMLAGALGYTVFHLVDALDGISQWYMHWNNTLLSGLTFLVLYFTFCKIDFRRMRLVRWHFHIALAQTLLGVVALGVALLVRDHPQWLVVMQAVLICIISPSASAAAVVTGKLGGNLEQMITFTLLGNVLSAVLIPTMLPHLSAHATDMSVVALGLHMLWRVVIVLLMPMLAAWLTRHVAPAIHRRIVETRNLSFYMWALCLMLVSGTAVKSVVDLWDETPLWLLLAVALSSLAITCLQFAIGKSLGNLTGHRIEAGQGLGQKNTTFAIWISAAFLHPLACLGPGCYILWQNIINSWQINRAEQMKRPQK